MAQYARYPVAGGGSTTITSPIGQQPMAASVSVAIASDQTAVPVSGTVTATNASIGATGAATPASATLVGGSDGTNLRGVKVSATGVVSVDGSASTQPISGTVTANAGSGTFAVSAAALPLPSGASTSALQTTGNTSLASIDSKLTNPLPVSGTVVATQSGTWTVQPGNTANTTPWLATVSQGGNSATVSAGGALKVDASASTQPVSGTVTANQGGAPWTVTGTGTAGTAAAGVVTVQGIASMTALKVDGSAVTQPISAASLPLPTGAATAAKQPALGTAGSASADVLTVQGIASMTALKVDGSATTQPVSGTVTANAGSGTFTTDQLATSTATFQDGAIAFGALTTSFATVITTGGALKVVQLRNNTNAVVAVSLDGGSTTAYTLDGGDAISVDLKTSGLNIPNSTNLQAKYVGSAPTSGSIRINGVR